MIADPNLVPPKRIYAIVADEVVDNGKFSFKFMAEALDERKYFADIPAWGAIVHCPNTSTVVPDGLTDVIFVFTSEYGQIYTSGNGLPFEDRIANCPSAVLLMDKRQVEKVEEACWKLGICLRVYYTHIKRIATS